MKEIQEQHTTQELARFALTDAAIMEMAAAFSGLVIASPLDREGAAAVSTARKHVKSKRVEVEKVRKGLNEDAQRHIRAVNGEAGRLTALLRPIEDRLIGEETKLAEWKREEEEREAARVRALIDERGKALADVGAHVPPSVLGVMQSDAFAALLREETRNWEIEQERKAAAERKRQEEELEAARVRLAEEAERKRVEEEHAKARAEAEAARVEAEAARAQAEEAARRVQAEAQAKQAELEEAWRRAQAEAQRKHAELEARIVAEAAAAREEQQRIMESARENEAALQRRMEAMAEAHAAAELQKAQAEAITAHGVEPLPNTAPEDAQDPDGMTEEKAMSLPVMREGILRGVTTARRFAASYESHGLVTAGTIMHRAADELLALLGEEQ